MGFIYCVIYAGCMGFLSFLLGRILPGRWFKADRFPYKTWNWEENGRIYARLFHIKAWQAKVPDMSKVFPGLMQKKKVTENFLSELPVMISETCIAEMIHVLLCVLALPCLLIWPGWGGILFTLLYILGNLPFIMIQRYNRPRFVRLKKKLSKSRKDG